MQIALRWQRFVIFSQHIITRPASPVNTDRVARNKIHTCSSTGQKELINIAIVFIDFTNGDRDVFDNSATGRLFSAQYYIPAGAP